MHLRRVRPIRQEPSPQGFRTLAKFHLEATPDITIYDCSIVRAPDGRVMVYGPVGKSTTTVLSLSPAARRAVIEMALDAVGTNVNDYHRSAA